MQWRPTASRLILEERAQLLAQLRAFFAARDVLEVDVPTLGTHTVTDVNLEPLVVNGRSGEQYLQTSPEYFLKRVLARDHRSIYSLGKAFRRDESGRRHQPEFTMLEWYRVGYDDRKLMDEVACLLGELRPGQTCKRISYEDAFRNAVGVNPHLANEIELRALASERTSFCGNIVGRSAWLDLLFSFCVEPTLGEGAYLIYDFPAEQSALARLSSHHDGYLVARRFELYWKGLELANGYWELTDAEEQAERFSADCAYRQERGLPVRNVDPLFLSALRNGLPDCAGVALGVDRLLMCLTEQQEIARVMPFATFE